VVVACDKFKGSLSGREVTEALAEGLTGAAGSDRGVDVVRVPVADGGEGTVEAALAAGFTAVPVTASGPTGEPVRTRTAWRADPDGPVVVVELADVCGLARLPGGRPAATTATSRGLGEVIATVLDAGARRLLIGVGGSASTDGGAGMVRALGARLLDARGNEIADGGTALAELDRIDLARLHPRLAEVEIVLAGDVANPLLGPTGAAAVFAPQKGATPGQVAALEAGLGRWAQVVTAALGRDDMDRAGAGAAGGVGYAAMALLGARMRPGIEVVLELAGFDRLLDGADLVITGEGSLDEQSLLGKAPMGVARAARAAGVPVIAVCGRSLLTDEQWRAVGLDAVHALLDLEPDPALCLRDAAALLRRIGARIAVQRFRP